jgi:mannose-6-phosphate isomerase-like protein (cupin superfamily)
MTPFTITNLLALDDVAAGHIEGVEARLARSALESEQLGISHFRYAPNVRAPEGHAHRVQEEIYLILGGSGRIKIDDEIRDVGEWDVIRIAPASIRALEAGPDGLEVVIVGSARPDGGDAERYPDWWQD